VQDTNYVNTAEAYENAGLCAMQVPDDVKATNYFQRAIQQDPRRAIAFLELAQINFKQNNFTQAQQYFNNSLNLTPRPDAEGLWLGVRLAHEMHDKTAAERYTLSLQNEYPNSYEYRQLRISQPLPMPKV
jgi:type IV pilus assembly protein PilF